MASRDKIFLDTDVALDHIADRQPFAEYAHRIFALAETGKLTACVSSLSCAPSSPPQRIPTGFRLKAQGCEA
jgi:hypothetical protein